LRLTTREVVTGAFEHRSFETHLLEDDTHPLRRSFRIGNLQVVHDRTGEQHRSLEHHAYRTAKLPGIDTSDVSALEQHSTAGRNIEPIAEPEQG